MDRRKIHKQLAKKIELESQIIKPRDTISRIQLNELNIKPSSTKSSAGGNGIDYIFERPPKFSISATNLKIKKAHSTTLSDFFSQQKESRLGMKNSSQKQRVQAQSRLAHTSDNKQPRISMKRKKTNDLFNQNPMNFYHRNSNAIVQHILKISESQVLHNMSRHKIQSSQNVSQSNHQDDNSELLQSSRAINFKSNTATLPNSSLRNTNQLNPLRNLATLTQSKQNVHFQTQDEQQQQQSLIQQSQQLSQQQQQQQQQLYQDEVEQQKKEVQDKNSEQKTIDSRRTQNNQFYSSQGDRQNISRDQSQEQLPASRGTKSQKMDRSSHQKMKHRDHVINPKKFYCLSSVGFKNYKYPRPLEMPYERESEKRTRMPLYLLPQSAPSKEIEDICINKYYSEVEEIEQSIVDKQQNAYNTQQYQSISQSQTQLSQDSIKISNGDPYIQGLEGIKKKYLNEIGYIQNKASSLQQKRKFKSNAKYTFSDSKSKELNQINMRSNRIEDISDTLCRNKNKIQEQMARTKQNISKLQQEHSSFIQQSMMQQTKNQINQSLQQLYKDLVQQSDDLKQNHKYTEEYRQKLEEEDEEGVDENEYQQYDGEEEEEKQQNDYDNYYPERENNIYGRKQRKSFDLMQKKELEQGGESAYIQEETEEEFQNDNSNYKFTETQLQQQISAQEEYINNFLKNSKNSIQENSSSQHIDGIKSPSSILKCDEDIDIQENLQIYNATQSDIQAINIEQKEQMQEKEEEEEEDDDQIKIHSLADFKNTQPLTDRDIIQKKHIKPEHIINKLAQLGQLMMNILIDTFTVLKQNRPALRNRILLSLGLNPQDIFQSVPKEAFELFYLVLVSKSASAQQNINFIIKFFKLDDDDEVEDLILADLSKRQKTNGSEIQAQKMAIDKDEFKRILRLLTISIDEKTKGQDKNLYDYMIENLTLTEVIKSNEKTVDLQLFKNILTEGKINPKDIVDLICNLQ